MPALRYTYMFKQERKEKEERKHMTPSGFRKFLVHQVTELDVPLMCNKPYYAEVTHCVSSKTHRGKNYPAPFRAPNVSARCTAHLCVNKTTNRPPPWDIWLLLIYLWCSTVPCTTALGEELEEQLR